ncbi:MAG TPA: iron ABC transporter permease [Bacteroidetes bacterium]|nr:iron ABC transporter permease [Bacteroidota bacterium]
MKPKINTAFWYLIFTALLLILFLANLWYGSVLISWSKVVAVITGNTGSLQVARVIVLEYRLPQAVTSLATGIALGVAGLLLQTLFRNPLAGPSVLGISSGASLGVALVVLLGSGLGYDILVSANPLSELSLVVAALVGALVVLLIILFVSNRIGNVVTVLIIGIMIGYAVSAIVGVLQFFSRAEELHAYVLWGLGSFSKTNLQQSVFLLLTALLGIFLAVFLLKPLNALLLGDHYAQNTGVNTKRVQTSVILISGFLVAVSTAFTGPIAFVGLAVPHLARSFFRTSNHRILLPAVILMGGGLTLFCNLVAKLPGYDTSLPINAVTSVIGAPVVVWVIIKRGRLKKG